MKVLLVCRENIPNPYVNTLAEGLAGQGVEVDVDCNKLWEDTHYDIVHFQWPEAVFDWTSSVSQQDINNLTQKLDLLKRNRTKIVITCHNLRPHSNKDKGIQPIYELIYNYCDMFVHMGNYSCDLLKGQYPDSEHVIIPHHIYNTKYSFDKEKPICQKKLGVNSKKFVILCFGEFRSDNEREFILRLNKYSSKNNYLFLTPSFYQKRFLSRNFREWPDRITRRIRYLINGLHCPTKFIDDHMLTIYFSACDMVMIQRHSVLNSGNLPMAFYAGKVVVGPNCGNVGQILKETGNPVFEPWSIDSALTAISEAKELAKANYGEENRRYAMKHWTTDIIVEELISSYNRLF